MGGQQSRENGNPTPARARCHFTRLAAVEVQEVMRCLDRRSLLTLARCSRRMHSDADSAAVWQSRPPLGVHVSSFGSFAGETPSGRSLLPRLGSRSRPQAALPSADRQRCLVRHIGTIRITAGPAPSSDANVDGMLFMPRVDELVDSRVQAGFTADQWRRICQHDAMANLTRITIGVHVPYDILHQFAQLPRLHTLDFTSQVRGITFGGHSVDVAALPSLPHLTSLTVTSLMATTQSSSLPTALGGCTQLTHLCLTLAEFNPNGFRRFFAATGGMAARLHHLELRDLSTGTDEYGDVFAALIGLRKLSVHSVRHMDSLLAGVVRAPNLATLDITGNIPSPTSLQMALAQTEVTNPFHITLRVPKYYLTHRFAHLDRSRFTVVETEG